MQEFPDLFSPHNMASEKPEKKKSTKNHQSKTQNGKQHSDKYLETKGYKPLYEQPKIEKRPKYDPRVDLQTVENKVKAKKAKEFLD